MTMNRRPKEPILTGITNRNLSHFEFQESSKEALAVVTVEDA